MRVFVILNQGKGCLPFEIHAGEALLFGRSAHCDIVINDARASREHCQVVLVSREEGWSVNDLGSSNGTYVGGFRIKGPTMLPFGKSLFLCGREVVFEPYDGKNHPFRRCGGCGNLVRKDLLSNAGQRGLPRNLCPDCRKAIRAGSTKRASKEDERTLRSLSFSVNDIEGMGGRKRKIFATEPTYHIKGYAIRERVADDRTGAVYLGKHDKTGESVLIRTVDIGQESEEQFIDEVKAVASINHPSMVRIIDFGKSEGQFYIAQEHVEGIDMRSYVKGRGPLPLSEALRAVKQISSVLGAHHGKGVVHVNLKPSNILRTKDGRYLLSEFGLAKLIAKARTDLTGSGVAFRTVRYSSPERLRHETPLDGRADLYSLGACLAFFVTGSSPFQGVNAFDVENRHPREVVGNLRRLVQGPPAFFDLLTTMLAIERDARPEDSTELIKLIGQVEDALQSAQLEDPAREEESTVRGAFQGREAFLKIIYKLEKAKVSGEFRIRGIFGLRTVDGQMWLRNGAIVWAQQKLRRGLDAAKELLGLENGTYTFKHKASARGVGSMKSIQPSTVIAELEKQKAVVDEFLSTDWVDEIDWND